MLTSKMRSLRSPLEYRKVQRFISYFVRGNRLGVRRRRLRGKTYLDVGCGYNVHESSINLDFYWHPKLDICWDVTQGIPLPDHSLLGIFTEHCLEHILLENMDTVLTEFKRLLRPGGTIRIIVPDGELYTKTYVERQDGRTQPSFPYEFQDRHGSLYPRFMTTNVF